MIGRVHPTSEAVVGRQGMTGVGLEPTTNGLTYRDPIAPSPFTQRNVRTSNLRRLPTICPPTPVRSPPDLAAVIDAWPDLPEPIRAGIVAMVKAASGRGWPMTPSRFLP